MTAQKKKEGLLCSWPLSLFTNSTCKYTISELYTVKLYVCLSSHQYLLLWLISIFHSLMQSRVTKMWHKTVVNLRFRPLKRQDFNHVMWYSVPCILNTRLCRPARRNIFLFVSSYCIQEDYLNSNVSISYKIHLFYRGNVQNINFSSTCDKICLSKY